MANYGAKILNNAISALSAQQAMIANISNNISNANTPGYTRRLMSLQARIGNATGGFSVGNGVEVNSINRVSDFYLEQQLRLALGRQHSYETQENFYSRASQAFNLTGEGSSVGIALTDFFTAVDELTTDPASIELRANFIERANDLANAINNTFNTIAQLQTEADTRLSDEVQSINSITAQIATLNGRIAGKEGSGNVATDERDQRDLLLQQLSEKVSFQTVENSEGAVLISLEGGFPLVSGTTSRDLEFTSTPSFVAGGAPLSLGGGTLGYIVFDYDSGAGSSHIDLTQNLMNGEGTVGGLLNIRGYNDLTVSNSAFEASGGLVELGTRVEAIARALLVTVNTTYLGPDADGVTAGHQPSSGGLDGTQPGVYGLFTCLGVADDDGDGLPSLADLAALGIDNVASSLSVSITDPNHVAAARLNGVEFPSGDASNMTAISGLRTTDLTVNLGNYSTTATFEEIYNETVSKSGHLSSSAKLNAEVASNTVVMAQGQRDETSAVSLDEEFAKLIQSQKSYEASARLIRTATQLLDEVLGLL